MLSCTIRHCGSFSIDWFIPSDDGTVFPPVIEVFGPDEGSTVSELTDLTDLTSVVTIDTVGLVNENESQVCYVVYEDEGEIGDFEFKMFDYTLESECGPKSVVCLSETEVPVFNPWPVNQSFQLPILQIM